MDLRESDSEPMLSDILAASLILLCLFNVAKFIDCLRLIYIHQLKLSVDKSIFLLFEK